MSESLCFTNSPSLQWFGHRIPEDGMVSAEDVRIYWNYLNPFRVRDVAVIFFPKDSHARRDNSHPLWAYERELSKSRRMSSGNCFTEWMSENPKDLCPDPEYGCDPHHDPDSLWKMFTQIGFLNDEEAKLALNEFARIRECEWARDPAWKLSPTKPLTNHEWAELNGLSPSENGPVLRGPSPPLAYICFADIVPNLNAIDEKPLQ